MNMKQCVFCNIIAKELPAYIVYEDDICMGFLDIAPIATGHTLIIPKQHYTDIFDLDIQYMNVIMQSIQCVASAICKTTGAKGIQIIQNNGREAGQCIFHIHWHIIPRYVDDGLLPWGEAKTISGDELQRIADSIQHNL